MFCFRGFICLALVWSLGSMVLGYGGRTWNIFGHSIPGQWNQTPDRHIIKGSHFRISPTWTLSQNGYGDLRLRRLYIIRLEYSHARKYTDADAVVLRAMLRVREAIVIIYNRRRRAQVTRDGTRTLHLFFRTQALYPTGHTNRCSLLICRRHISAYIVHWRPRASPRSPL